MKKSRLMVYSSVLLAVVVSAGLTGCGNKQAVTSSNSNSQAESSETPVSSSTTVYVSHFVVKQPETLVVGDTLKLSDYVTITPTNGEYNAVSTDTTVATVANKVVTIVGAGTCSINLTSGTQAAKLNITAMSVNGKAIKDIANSITTNYFMSGSDAYFTDDAHQTKMFDSDAHDIVLVKDKYDHTNGIWNNIYSYVNLKDVTDSANPKQRAYKYTLEDPTSTTATDLAITKTVTTVDDMNSQFAFEEGGLLDLSVFTEQENGTFVSTDATVVEGLEETICAGYATVWRDTASFTWTKAVVTNKTTGEGDSAQKSIDISLEYTAAKGVYSSSAATYCVSNYTYKDIGSAKIPLLDTYLTDNAGVGPTLTDVSPVANAFKTFTDADNYIVSYKAGTVKDNKSFEFDDSTDDNKKNNFEGTINRTSSAVWVSGVDHEATPVAHKYGYETKDSGLITLAYDSTTSKITEGSAVTGATAVTTMAKFSYFNTGVITSDLLSDGAILQDSTNTSLYTYAGTSDSVALALALDKIAWPNGKGINYYDSIAYYPYKYGAADVASLYTASILLGTNQITVTQWLTFSDAIWAEQFVISGAGTAVVTIG